MIGSLRWTGLLIGCISFTLPARAAWVAKHSGTLNALTQVQIVDATNIWATGVGGEVLHSTDAGETWDVVDSGAPAGSGAWNSVHVVDGTGWFAGLKVTARTTNSGDSWTGALIANNSLNNAPWQNALFATSSLTAWTVGADYHDVGGGNVLGVPSLWYHTVNAQGEFTNYKEYVIPIGGIFADLDFVDADNGWAVGVSDQPEKSGIIFRIQLATSDDPLITPQASGVTTGLEGVSIIDEQRGWIVGEGGLVLHTQNGGAAWTSQPTNVTTDLWDVYFVDAARGWAVGEGGLILTTLDGGKSWGATTWEGQQALTSVHFLTAGFGFAVGTGGTILAWEDDDCAGDVNGCGGSDGGGAGGGGEESLNEGGAGGETSGSNAGGAAGQSEEVGGMTSSGNGGKAGGGTSTSSGASSETGGGDEGPAPAGAAGHDNEGGASAQPTSGSGPRQSSGCTCRVVQPRHDASMTALALLSLTVLRRAARRRQ